MLIPRTLTFQNIGRYVIKQTIYFDDMRQLVQIDGLNKNTGGSSGASKSTLFNALEYNLGLNDIPVTVLQSRLTREGIYTEGKYDWDGKEVIIIRGKGKFSISVDGTLVEGSAKLVEEKIDEIMGMSRDLFRPILHKRQKEGGFFLNLTPSEVHEFMTNVLNLGEYSKKLEKVDKDIKELTAKKEQSLIDLQSSRTGLIATQDAILALGLAPIRDMHQSVVLEQKTKADVSYAKLQLVIADHKTQNEILETQRPIQAQTSVLPSPILDTTPFNRTIWDNAVTKRTELETELNGLLELEKNRIQAVKNSIQEKRIQLSTLNHKVTLANTAKDEAAKVAKEVMDIRQCICPTCKQQWVVEAAKIKETELLTKLATLKSQISEGANSSQVIKVIDEEIQTLSLAQIPQINPRISDINAEISDQSSIVLQEKAKYDSYTAEQAAKNTLLSAAHRAEQEKINNEVSAKNKAANDEFALKQTALRNMQTAEKEFATGQADIDRRTFESAANKLKAFEEANARYTVQISTLKAQEEQYNQKLVNIDQILVHTEAQLVVAEESKRAIKSFMSCSFDEALDEIGDAATDIIRAIPNMANATVQFQGIRETQSGKIKEEVNAVISMDGEEGIDIRSLSGGERSSADLAIDLAVIDLIENRSNKGVSIFILDEPFTGLDTVSIEMVLEVLKNAKINKKLIIVDHNPEVKQMVESRLVAVRDGLTSVLEQ